MISVSGPHVRLKPSPQVRTPFYILGGDKPLGQGVSRRRY